MKLFKGQTIEKLDFEMNSVDVIQIGAFKDKISDMIDTLIFGDAIFLEISRIQT